MICLSCKHGLKTHFIKAPEFRDKFTREDGVYADQPCPPVLPHY